MRYFFKSRKLGEALNGQTGKAALFREALLSGLSVFQRIFPKENLFNSLGKFKLKNDGATDLKYDGLSVRVLVIQKFSLFGWEKIIKTVVEKNSVPT